ncbi:hypothetical protein DFH94DRAFT_438041 [Russula ochroleuca]|jgi:hypothetical protein|uniref:Uncharacterized protein n=1 Tax=Russula ochroleuca TaxID=152965 RepID=A0A9P5MXD9_9AGAM|nr:hypothetical protein DFH94DRAFT_438041 [Russula ochroleuca]
MRGSFMQRGFGVRPSRTPDNSTTSRLQSKRCQRIKTLNCTVSLVLTFLFFTSCACCPRADLPPSSHGPSSQASYDQYPTGGGSIVIAKPLNQPPVNNPVYDDYLHVAVACLVALLLTVLLGLVIRHYGLTLPGLTRSQRSKRQRSPAGDTESSPQPETRKAVTGLGFEESEKVEESGMDDSELPEKPEAAHLKWR